MKIQTVAFTAALVAGSVMMAGVSAAQPTSHTQEVRSLLKAEFEARKQAPRTLAIGDTAAGYNPIDPCRIADTRSATDGRFAQGETRNFEVATDDLSFQGGSATGCDIPENASAVTLNVTVVNPGGNGFLTAFPGGEEQPATSTVNYTTGATVGNGTTIANGDGIDVFAFRALDVVIDVTGFFALTELECFSTENAGDAVEADEVFVGLAVCPIEYTAVGGFCDQALDSAMPLIANGTFSEFGGHLCVFNNAGGDETTAFTDISCCRTANVPVPEEEDDE